jgi:hypothetical protein
VKRISILALGVLLALAVAPAQGQDFTAGKTPAQLFASDCAECHRTPNGLAKKREVKDLASFLREHYTTKPETAGSLAAYVSGFTGSGPADIRNRAGTGPSPATADKRNPAAEDARTAARTPEDQAGRRRRTTNLSGDGEKRRVRDDDAPRPPGNIATASTAPTRTASRAGDSASREATDPLSRLRAYLTSGLGSEGAIAEAAKTRPPKSRKRAGQDTVQAPPETPAPVKSSADMPALMVPPGATAAATAAATPAEGNGGQTAPVPAPVPVAPAPAAVVTPPRLGQ